MTTIDVVVGVALGALLWGLVTIRKLRRRELKARLADIRPHIERLDGVERITSELTMYGYTARQAWERKPDGTLVLVEERIDL